MIFIARASIFKRSYSKHRYHSYRNYWHRSKVLGPLILLYQRKASLKPYFGAHGAEEIPVPIPNTEVKLSSGDYTATSGKLARCRIIQ